MNTKYLLAVGAIVTSLTLGACGNSNSESDLITKINNKKTVM